MIVRIYLLISISLVAACANRSVGHTVTTRPVILDNAAVIQLDPNGNGSQVAAFLRAHHLRQTAGVCQGMLTVEWTSNDWCIITESGTAYMVIDYTQDPFGINGYRISPLVYKGKNRFYRPESKQNVTLLPWKTNG